MNYLRPTIIGLLALAAVVLLISPFGPVTPALADSPSGTINVDSIVGNTVNLSGNWSFDACDPSQDKKMVAFGIFIDGKDPTSGPSEDTVMHFPADQVDSGIPGQVPCTNDTGSWSDSHVLTPGQHQVCVVFYDPHLDEETGLPETSGSHSDILTGPGDHNTDNSFEKNADQFSVGECTPTLTNVSIDIKPGSDPNSTNLGSMGVIPVAILTTPTFDATTVDANTVQFGPGAATKAHAIAHVQDVDGDGDLDLLFHFRTQDTEIAGDDTEACLTGQTFGGIAIEGCDTVRIVPPDLDSDGDGFGDAVEATVGTDQFAACSLDASHDAWPADVNNDGFSDIRDIVALAGSFGEAASLALPRYDVEPDGFVDISDIVAVAAFFGQGCAGP